MLASSLLAGSIPRGQYPLDCPRQGRLDGPICTITLFDPWVEALRESRPMNAWRCCTGCIRRGGIWFGKARPVRGHHAGPLRYVPPSGPIRLACRSLSWWKSAVLHYPFKVSTASTARHCWTLSLTDVCSVPSAHSDFKERRKRLCRVSRGKG